MAYRTALITGASSGIGAGLARRLANQGTTVVVCARREAELESLATDIRAANGKAMVRVIDVSDGDATATAIRSVDDEVGGLDLVIANAGIGTTSRKPPTWESARDMCHVNFAGAIATLTAILPRMLERRRGHLVGVSSLAALSPLPTSSVYSATKAGLTMFLTSLQLDLRGTGVHATVVHPGFVRTPLTDKNRFNMPFILEIDDAVERIVTSLPNAPASIDFPLPLLAAIRFSAALPAPLRALALSRSTRPR